MKDILKRFFERDSEQLPTVCPELRGEEWREARMQEPDVYHVRVAGTSNYQAVVTSAKAGDCCRLVPEPQNPYDSGAIRVDLQSGGKLGYIPRDRTEALREAIEAGCEVAAFIDGTGRPGVGAPMGVALRIEVTFPPDPAPGPESPAQ